MIFGSLKIMGLTTTLFASSLAVADHNGIHGFTFNTCGPARCVQVKAPVAWLSQLNFGFATSGATEVQVWDLKGAQTQNLKVDEASFYPELGILSLDLGEGSTTMISIVDGSIKNFAPPQALAKPKLAGHSLKLKEVKK